MEKVVVVPDMVKSLIMPAVTVRIPMPQGAAYPAQTNPPPPVASQVPPSAAPRAPQRAVSSEPE
jgi:hypothetical protein